MRYLRPSPSTGRPDSRGVRGLYMKSKTVTSSALVLLMLSAVLSGCFGLGGGDSNDEDEWEWVDPVVEIEDENHSHSDLMAHRLKTPNARKRGEGNKSIDIRVSQSKEKNI